MPEELLEPAFRKLRIRRVKKYLGKGLVLCDIGCGNGTFLRTMAPYVSWAYGFDKKAIESESGNVTIKKMQLADGIPLESGSADCVTMMAVLEHLEAAHDTLGECHRIIKPGGLILMTTPAPISKPILEFLSFRLNIVSRDEILDHKHYYSKAELRDMLQECGFERVEVRSFEFGLNNFVVGYKG